MQREISCLNNNYFYYQKSLASTVSLNYFDLMTQCIYSHSNYYSPFKPDRTCETPDDCNGYHASFQNSNITMNGSNENMYNSCSNLLG